ncbi:MAG: valine--tRNA ligase [Oscillospiraceae bacterium]
MSKELPKAYEPQEVEERIYKAWEENGCFEGHRDPEKKPFTIVMPPPNVTGQLHMGHAMDCTLQDILTRWKRMQGYAALWVPGADHAGIATQIKVEEALRNEGITRYDLGREKFLDKVWEWKEKYGGRIVEQQKKLGSSCDWSRARFTMDDGLSKAVRHVFVEMYNKGLIYKGSRIINWCPHCTTALSDAEVEYQDKPGHLWYLKYPIKGEEGRFVVVATTRPETMMGDTGVAVNPNDARYKDLVGKTCILPLMDREIPIVADDYVDMAFGTGCVKMTPAHDPNDFEVGLRHNLETIRVLADDGKVNENGGKYVGMERYAARKAVMADLEALGLVEKIEPHQHNVGTCYRCHSDVEPLISAQWFVKMEPLAAEALRVVNDGEVQFVPDRFSKTYTNWMENVHDWCISRQLWWGHQIPVWYCADCGKMTVSETDATECEHCHSKNITRDEDVLDTWFSSALWPFSTLGWPDKTPDFDYFYPTDVLVTGYDIIFFWVARMIFSGCEHTGKPPFHTVLIHGLVRDDKGRKMSKSLGNGIDPLEIIDKYGCDALRFNLVTGNAPGNDMRFLTERCEAMRNFANKIWNASRFLMMNLTIETCTLPEHLEIEDKWILSKLNTTIRDMTDNMEKYELGVGASKIYDFIWDSYCDWYIEFTKTRLQGDDEDSKTRAQQVLCYVLTEFLKLLHPYMPFLTEEIWQALPHEAGVREGDFLMLQKWPEYRAEFNFAAEETAMETVMEAISALRTRRAEMNVPPSKKAKLTVVTENVRDFTMGIPFLMKLGYASEVELAADAPADSASLVSVVTHQARMFIPLAELVDMKEEKARAERELVKAKKDFDVLTAKLSNKAFADKAPAAVVAAERERAEKVKSLIAKLEAQIAAM